jgi:hypothetical protein
VALQGTIDAFPLTDVLQLLSSSSKSGRLLLDGDRGSAALWIEEGTVVGAGDRVDSAAVAVFELLRHREGSFSFEATADLDGQAPEVELDPVELSECLADAGELLTEWSRIEAVVPSMQHRVQVVAVPEQDTVTLDRDEWALVVAAGDTPSVAELARRRDQGEFACCSSVAGMVARSLVDVLEPSDRTGSAGAEGVAAPPGPALEIEDLYEQGEPAPDDATSDDDAASDPGARELDDVLDRLLGEEGPADEEGAFPQHFPIDDLVGDDGAEGADPWDRRDHEEEHDAQRFAAAQTFEPLGGLDEPRGGSPFVDHGTAESDDRRAGDPTAAAWDEIAADTAASSAADVAAEESADEVLRQMQRLSPKAAEAIAAALSTPGQPGSAVDTAAGPDAEHSSEGGRGDGEGPITFLGSL